MNTYWIKYSGMDSLDSKEFEPIKANKISDVESIAYENAKEDYYSYDHSGYETEDFMEDDPALSQDEAAGMVEDRIEQTVDYCVWHVPTLELQIAKLEDTLKGNPLNRSADYEWKYLKEVLDEINDLRDSLQS